MRLEKLKYSQHENTPAEWKINELTLTNINLIVGRNAVGKTRTINVISGLARLLSEEKKIVWSDGNYEVDFLHEGKRIEYEISYHERSINKEKLTIDDKELLTRDDSGEGTIFFHEENRPLKFQTPVDEVASFVRRDSIQHPFLEYLNEWGVNFVLYKFGEAMGQRSVIITKDLDSILDINIKDTENIVSIFLSGLNSKFGDEFKENIIKDMKLVDYDISDIQVLPQTGFKLINAQIPMDLISEKPSGISVTENDLAVETPQNEMSQGMFRCLSVIIQFNYFLLHNKFGTILIDDIGEGLDYSRSSSLISLLIEKAESSKIQLIMTTNDRFVMNHVPIKYWIILHREGGEINCYNNRNSKEIFSKFESTGLNNFDLLTSNYYLLNNQQLENND